MRHTSYLELVNEVSNHELFERWTTRDCTQSKPANMHLLVLSVIRYLGRAWNFDDIDEATASREAHIFFYSIYIVLRMQDLMGALDQLMPQMLVCYHVIHGPQLVIVIIK